MVYESFQPSSTESQGKDNLDTGRVLKEAGASIFSAALTSSLNRGSDAVHRPDQTTDADNLLGAVSFVGAEIDQPEQPDDAALERPSIKDLEQKYGIFVSRIITPSRQEYCVYQNNKLQFTTTGADLEAELKKQGFHPLQEMGCDKNTSIGDYHGYLERHYGLKSVHMITGSKSEYYFYGADGKTVASGTLGQVQERLEKNNVARIGPEAPGKKIVTHLPGGETSIEYADGSEVILNKDKQVMQYTTARGDVLTPENTERNQWRTSDGTSLQVTFSFESNGNVSFEIQDDKNPLAKRTYTGEKGIDDVHRDGSKASYADGVVKSFVTADGTALRFDTEGRTRTFAIQEKGGKSWQLKASPEGRLVPAKESDAEPDENEQRRLQTMLGNAYEKMGKFDEAIQHHGVVLSALEKEYTAGSLEVVDQHGHLAEIRQKKGDAKGAEWHTREITEVRRVSEYLGRVDRAPDDLARAFVVADALPGNLTLDTSGKVIRFDFTDAGKALEAIPGLRLPGTRDLTGLKAIAVEGNKFKIAGTGNLKFKMPDTEIFADVKFNNVTCDIGMDPNDSNKIKLTNIKGLTISAMGAKVMPEHLTLSKVKNPDGSDSLKIEFGKLIPAPADKNEIVIPGLSSLVAEGAKDVQPVEIPVPADVKLDRLLCQVCNWVKDDNAKDAGKMFEAIVGLYANTELSGVFGNISQMKKDGNKIEIETTGDRQYNFGGIPVGIDKKVSTELQRDGDKVALSNIEGLKARIAIPADVANGLGMQNPMEIALKEVTLSAPDKDGNRIATIKTDSIVDSVSIKVGPRFEPIRDQRGNISVEATLKRGDAQATVKWTANPDQLAKGDPKDIDFTIQVTGGSDKSAEILQGFFGHELDPTVKELINGVESITKTGDQFTINRKDAKVLDQSGLKVHVARSVGFKFDPTKAQLELKDITGIHIVDLPDVAGKIYAHKMPISMRYLGLSPANQNGERVLTMRADGVVSSATIYLDAAMKPKEIIAVVENPAKHLKESMGNRDMLARRLDMVTKGKSYAIRIKADGSVDLDGLGGVGGVSDMLLNGGDLVSVTGAASTAAGYVGTSITRGSHEANRGLGEKIIQTWEAIFGK